MDDLVWIKETLVPIIVEREKAALRPTNDVSVKELAINRFHNEGSFLVTICYKVTFVLCVDGDEDRTIGAFVKMAPKSTGELDLSDHFETLFRNEIIAYDSILSALSAAIELPKCYYAHQMESGAVIAISDFTYNNYSMSKSVINLSLDHVLAAMLALGKFHGTSYAMKYLDPLRFDSLKNQLPANVIQKRLNPGHELILKGANERAMASFRKRNVNGNVNNGRVETVPDTFLNDLDVLLVQKVNEFRFALNVPREPLAIICHGDYLRNNIAFKYDAPGGLATDAMFFDFQTICYASPMLDFSVFLANSISHDIRQRHFDEIFQTYYDALINQFMHMTQMTSDQVPTYMSCEAFMREYALHAPYGLQIAAFFIAISYNSQSDFTNIDTLMTMINNISTMGGEAVDWETSAQIMEIYQLCVKYKVNLLDIVDRSEGQ